MSTTPTLCYWDIRGLAQPIRLLLNYTGTKFEDKQLSCGPAPDFDKTCWFDNKFSFGLDFPNLPYYIDGDVKVTQSNAILRHIARQHNMCGTTVLERARVDMMADQVMDFRNGWVRLCYNPDFDNKKGEYLASLTKTLESFSNFLGTNTWTAGETLTFPDFHLYELLVQHQMLVPDCLAKLSNLANFVQRFQELPQIAAYMSSSQFMKSPINNKMAKFGFQ